MQAVALIQICARDVNDIGYERVAKDVASSGTLNMPNWLDWLNDGQRAVCTVRPDANSQTQNLTLVAGARQTLPAGALRMLRPTRNMGADGATVGKTVRFTEGSVADNANRSWQLAAPASPVREVLYDEKSDPLTFWVNPPGVATWKLEAILAQPPTDVPNPVSTNLIQLTDAYAPALIEWMLYRNYALATQALQQWQRAVGHFNAFFNLLGVKLKADMFYDPRSGQGFPDQKAAA